MNAAARATFTATLGFAGVVLLFPSCGRAQDQRNQVWDNFGGNAQSQKYSMATQITPANAKNLKTAWSLHTGDVSTVAPKTTWGATPLFVNSTVYVGTPKYRLFAVEPDTGKVKWVYTAKTNITKPVNQGLKSRGISYWHAANPVAGQPCQKMIYMGTMDGHLHAVDADTGRLCRSFGNNGVLDVNQWNTINPK